jgi:hypothetical protein
MITRISITISAIAQPGNAFFSGSTGMADAGSAAGAGAGASACNPLTETGGGAGGKVAPLTVMGGGGVSSGNPVTAAIILLY